MTCDAADHKCAGTALQTAINGGGTVYVCPGEYTGRFTVGQDASVTIVGAGTGDNPATSTILKTTNYVNLEVTSATSCAVTRLRIEGNLGDSESPPSSGLRIVDSHATFTNCDFSRFGPKYNTHAFRTLGSTVELVNCLLHNSHNSVSGGVRVEGGSLTLNRTTIRNNSTVNFGGGIDVEEAGTVTLSNGSLITENRAGPEGGGGIYAAAGTTVNISSDSTVVANLDVNNEISNCQGAGTFNGTCG